MWTLYSVGVDKPAAKEDLVAVGTGSSLRAERSP